MPVIYRNMESKRIDIEFTRFAEDYDDPERISEDHYGNRVITSTLSREEVCKLMKEDCTDLAITDQDLELFNHPFTYLFDGYTVYGCGDNPLTECKRQLIQLYANSNDHHLIKIWTSPANKISASELKEFRRWIALMDDDEHNDTAIYSIRVGIGVDPTLFGKEVRIDWVSYYNEMCWPPRLWFNWIELCRELPLDELKDAESDLRKQIGEQILDGYHKEVYEDCIVCGFLNMRYHKERKWDESEKVLDYLSGLTDEYKWMAHEFARNLKYLDDEEIHFGYRLLLWVIEHGAYLNIFNEGETLLDCLKNIEGSNPTQKAYIRGAINHITYLGAKTKEQLYAEEDSMPLTYDLEIQRIGDYCRIYKWH